MSLHRSRPRVAHSTAARALDVAWWLVPSALLAACAAPVSPRDAMTDDAPTADSASDAPVVDADTGTDTSPGDVTTDAASCRSTSTRLALTFERRQLDMSYRTEGVGAFDVNADGRIDVVTDQFWFDSARDFARHPIGPDVTYDPLAQFPLGYGAYPMDINRDGCMDVVSAPHANDPFYAYLNPCRGFDSPWASLLIENRNVVGIENPFLTTDLFADHRPVVIAADSPRRILGFYERPASATDRWTLTPVSTPGFVGAESYRHGVGVGDVDGDGRADILSSYGWFQQTANPTQWTAHIAPNTFPDAGDACSRMWTFDVNCDGLADVFCARPHSPGIHWFEQRPVAPGTDPLFIDHVIDTAVTEMHALALADLDGDGVPELVSGTRWCSHCAGSAMPDPAVPYVVYYSIERTSTSVAFERHVVDDNSGVGVAIAVADLNGDGRPDIATANKRGLFVFLQRP